MKYVKLYTDALYAYKRLSDTEFGRAIRALLQYVEDGTEASLPGKESIMFDVLREQVERDKTAYNTRVENGSKGGRKPKPKETEPNRKNRTVNSVTETPYDKDKEYIPPYSPPMGWIEEDEEAMLARNALLNEVYDRARDSGFHINQAGMKLFAEYLHDYGKENVFYALSECVKSQAINFRYLEKVLKGQMQNEVKTEAMEDTTGGWLFT